MDAYRAFVESKVAQASVCGFEVAPPQINPALKDHTQAMVRWALMGGRRGRGCELSAPYWKDSIWYCRAAEAERATPSLFDFEKEAA